MAAAWKDNLLHEIKFGGSEAPCPRCGVPRVKRSTYIRCAACGTNWEPGEPLDQDPRDYRRRKYLAGVSAVPVSRREEKREDKP